VLWLCRAEDRKYLAGAWKVKDAVAADLAKRFGFTEWDVSRGTDRRIIGFIPSVRDEKGNRLFVVAKLVYDMRAVRGLAAMDLQRLEMRG
jgi:hypothetical protein